MSNKSNPETGAHGQKPTVHPKPQSGPGTEPPNGLGLGKGAAQRIGIATILALN